MATIKNATLGKLSMCLISIISIHLVIYYTVSPYSIQFFYYYQTKREITVYMKDFLTFINADFKCLENCIFKTFFFRFLTQLSIKSILLVPIYSWEGVHETQFND